MSAWPERGARYQHRKTGGVYLVLMVAATADGNYAVVYQLIDGTMPWVRPLAEFGEMFRDMSDDR